MLNFTFSTNPKAVQSFRFTKTGHRYQPPDVKQWKAAIRAMAISQIGDVPPLTGGVVISIQYVFKVLKGFSKSRLNIIRNGGKIYKITKPDLTDNLQKGFIDSLSGVIWEHDQQICKMHDVEKIYGFEPKIILKVDEIDEIQEENLFNRKIRW